MEPFNTEESGGSTIQRSAASARKTRLLGGYVSPLTDPAPAGGPANLKLELGGLRKGQVWRPAPLEPLDQVSRLIEPARPPAPAARISHRVAGQSA